MLIYLEMFLFILFGAVLNDCGISIRSGSFWLILVIFFGIHLINNFIIDDEDKGGKT